MQAKGQWTILESLATVNEPQPYEFHFFGQPLETEPKQWDDFLETMNQLQRQGWTLKHEGFEKDPMRIYTQLDILVIPSIVPEAFGLTAIEAMSREVLVIANRSGALVEIIRDRENGFLYDAEDPTQLPQILEDLASGKYAIDKIRQEGLRTVEQYYHPTTQLNRIHDLVRTRVIPYLPLKQDKEEVA